MTRWGLIGILAGLLGLQAAPATVSAQVENEPVAQAGVARQIFLRYCASCHGSDARGNGPVASDLKTQPSDLTRIAERRNGKFPAAEIAQYIDGRVTVVSHGTREMPVWGERFSRELGGDSVAQEISRGRIDVLVGFLQSIQAPAPAPPEKE